MQNPEETFFAERIAANIVPLHRARHNRKMGQRAFGAESDSGRERQRRRPVQEPHFLLRLWRQMFLEGGREGHDAHQIKCASIRLPWRIRKRWPSDARSA